MMKRAAILLLAILCLMPGLARVQEAQPSPPQGEALTLPDGVWMLVDGGTWAYLVQEAVALDAQQAQVAADSGVALEAGVLTAGTSLTEGVLRALFPQAAQDVQTPLLTPSLELFSLAGEWYYGQDGVLYYRHGEGYAPLTVDEVFAQLGGTRQASAEEKVIYLTIDDSPSEYTMDLLATLDRLDVKATFFVVGAFVKKHPVFLRAIYEQGHGIANHSYSHDAANLSSSFKNCLADFRRCEKEVEQALGFPLAMPILRIPYGASTIPVSFRTELQKQGYLWIDWNALNGDTESAINSDEAALERAFSTARRYDGAIVMLVHDGKKRTIRTMEAMVEHFRGQGYRFEVLSTDIEKMPGVRMGLPK